MAELHQRECLVARQDFGECYICGDALIKGSNLWPMPLKFECDEDSKFIIPLGKGYVHYSCALTAAAGRSTSLVRPDCKHWVRKGQCYFSDQCFFRHVEQHRGTSPRSKLGKNSETGGKRRPRVFNDSKVFTFRRFLIDTFGRDALRSGSGVLDLAGGQGELSFQLVNLNRIPSTVVDPRPLRLRRFVRKLAFGMYTRNLVLQQYNDIDTPPDPALVEAPTHLRTLFQVPAGLVGRKDIGVLIAPTNKPPDTGSPQVQDYILALESPEVFEACKKQAHSLNWTNKGLKAEHAEAATNSEADCAAAIDPPYEEDVDDTVPIPHAREIDGFEEACDLIINSSCIVGMHPDQAACEAIAFAKRFRKPFAIVPCCVYGMQYPKRKLQSGEAVKSQEDLVEWLVENGPPGTKLAELDFDGKNRVVYWEGPQQLAPSPR